MIIITGASRGIGKFLFEHYEQLDLTVVGTYNNTITAKSDRLYKIDINDYNAVNCWINSLEDKLNNIILINCAAKNYNSFAHKVDMLKWRSVIETNLFGTFNLINAVLPHMRKQNYGRIINFASVTAQVPTPAISAYAASKSALWGLTKSIAIECGKHNITINNINLGYSELGMINEVPNEFLNQILQKIPSHTL